MSSPITQHSALTLPPPSLHDALPSCEELRWRHVVVDQAAAPGVALQCLRQRRGQRVVEDHGVLGRPRAPLRERTAVPGRVRSEEHTSELQSLRNLVCRLLLEYNKI